MKYLGNLLTDKGLQVSGDKVADIVPQATSPKDQSELRNVLDLAQLFQRLPQL